MITPASILHALAGSPAFAGAEDHAQWCYLCGTKAARTLPVAKWMGSTFTDQLRCRAQWSDRICEACAWSCSWVTPPGYVVTGEMAAKKAAKRAAHEAQRAAEGKPAAGKEVGENLRLFTHLYSGGKYGYFKKDSKPSILAFLRGPKVAPWFAAVADKGQKHVLPFADVNHCERGGLVLFEDREVTLPSSEDGWRVLDDAAALLTAGATKDEIERGEYRADTWARCGEMVRAFEDAHAALRGGAWLSLVIWLAQRDESAVVARQAAEKAAKEAKKNGERKGPIKQRATGAPAKRDGQRRPRVARDVPSSGSEPAEALGAAREPHPSSDAHVCLSRGVGHGDEARAEVGEHKQLALFGGDAPGR